MKHLINIKQGYVKVPVSCVGELKQENSTLLYLHGSGTSVERQETPAMLLYGADKRTNYFAGV